MKSQTLLLILLLPAAIFAVGNSQDTEYAKLKLTVWRDLTTTQQLNYGTLTAYDAPQSSQALSILSQTLAPNAGYKIDTMGNTYIEAKWFNTANFPYQNEFTIESRAQMNTLTKPPPFPLPAETAGQAKEYLAPSYYAPITPELEAKALEITQGSKDSFEAAAKIATWLHDNIVYDARYGSVIEPAPWVLENKVGVCDEYSHAFISMARAVGIPARYVSGIAYGKSTLAEVSWQNHAWAEAYLGQWVPIDPTWGEIGYVDATHIKLGVGTDGKDLETKFEWVPDTAKVQLSEIKYTVQELEYRNFSSRPVIFSTTTDSDTLGTGSYFLIESTLKNNMNGCIAEEAKLSTYSDPSGNAGKSFSTENSQQPLLSLCPGEEKKAGWIARSPARLDEGYTYSYDAIAYDMFSESTLKLTIDPRISDKPNLRMTIDRTILTPGEPASVTIEAENTLTTPITSLRLYTGEEMIEQKISIAPGSSASATFIITPKKPGTMKLTAYAPHNAASSQISVITTKTVVIQSIQAPETAAPAAQTSASATIQNTGKAEQTVKISASLDSTPLADQYATLKPKESKTIAIPFTIPASTKLGNYKLSIKAALNDEKSQNLLVYENKRPEITQEQDSYFSEVSLDIKLKIKNTATLPLADLKATIAGNAPINIGTLQPNAETTLTYTTRFDSAGKKEIPLQLEYKDQFKNHTEEYAINLTATQPGLLDKIIYYIKKAVYDVLYKK